MITKLIITVDVQDVDPTLEDPENVADNIFDVYVDYWRSNRDIAYDVSDYVAEWA